MKRSRRRKRSPGKMALWGAGLFFIVALGGVFIFLLRSKAVFKGQEEKIALSQRPEELLALYIERTEKGEYEAMYGQLSPQSRRLISKEKFIERNKNIYEGICAENMELDIKEISDNGDHTVTVAYDLRMDTAAGEIFFSNYAVFSERGTEETASQYSYGLAWDHNFIFPQLSASDKIRVQRQKAVRGSIVDRNGLLLAGQGVASSVGIVPGKMGILSGEAASFQEGGAALATSSEAPPVENPSQGTEYLRKTAELLGVSEESVWKKLSASWVKQDSFVPIKTIEKLEDGERLTDYPSEEAKKKRELEEELLSIPGVMITDTDVRIYPFGESASHLTGYIQEVTAEDLEKHPEGGYSAGSMIGRSGLESLYEKELKGEDGCKIIVEGKDGKEKFVLAQKEKKDGQTIQLTIDAKLQETIYQALSEEKSCTAAIHPYTGEILALVSTPSFNSQDFIYGMSQEKWNLLNEDKRLPLYNRFRQKLCPGSSFKPVIGAIGVDTGAIDPQKDYGDALGGNGRNQLEWQKDSSWGNYYVTTLHACQPATLEKAVICSDNIYFAKAALLIGKDALEKELDNLGFGKELPFEISTAQSQYTNGEGIETEIQLADSGYGQGEILVNPIHLAALYTGFANHGDVWKPYIKYGSEPEIWLKEAYSPYAAELIKEAMIQVIQSPAGTGRGARRDDVSLAGKTGTAEIKASKDDTSGTELGWFAVFTADPEAERPIMMITMVEDVKGRGGSGYVVEKSRKILDQWFGRREE